MWRSSPTLSVESNDNVIFQTNDDNKSIDNTTVYKEMIANLKDLNVSLKSKLQDANTKKYAPIRSIITLDDIPVESRERVRHSHGHSQI